MLRGTEIGCDPRDSVFCPRLTSLLPTHAPILFPPQVLEIERLEKDVAEMRNEVKAREAQTAITKAARQSQNTSLEAAAAQMEAQLVETSVAAARMLEEVKSMFPIIDYAFYAIGCDKAFVVPHGGSASPSSPTKGGASAPSGSSSPLRSKTASLKMYMSNPAMKQDVKSGVNASSVSQFMGIIENRSADIIQQYAAVNIGGVGALEIKAGGGSRSASPAPDADGFRTVGGAGARVLSPAALGPSRPTGRLKESLTSSALVAALAVDAAKMEAPEADRGDDELRPISLDELKRQAAKQMEMDKGFKAVKSAALQAASVLTRGGVA
jgi:hypothetical protein